MKFPPPKKSSQLVWERDRQHFSSKALNQGHNYIYEMMPCGWQPQENNHTPLSLDSPE